MASHRSSSMFGIPRIDSPSVHTLTSLPIVYFILRRLLPSE
uniref:Uncharacterized protein n=1 Tax=Arundo donax TaxID=35708 RepID=A0A0A9CCC6_ARUDO